MPQNVVDADTFTATVVCQADGDAVNGAACLQPAQDLADRTRWLHNRNISSAGGVINMPLDVVLNLNTKWSWSSGGVPPVVFAWQQDDVTGSDGLYLPVPNWFNTTFTGVTARIEGSAGHGGTPATRPALKLVRCTVSTGAMSTVGTTTDTATVGGAPDYEGPHDISLTFAAQTMSSGYVYYVGFTGEHDGNSQAGLLLYSLGLTIVAA